MSGWEVASSPQGDRLTSDMFNVLTEWLRTVGQTLNRCGLTPFYMALGRWTIGLGYISGRCLPGSRPETIDWTQRRLSHIIYPMCLGSHKASAIARSVIVDRQPSATWAVPLWVGIVDRDSVRANSGLKGYSRIPGLCAASYRILLAGGKL